MWLVEIRESIGPPVIAFVLTEVQTAGLYRFSPSKSFARWARDEESAVKDGYVFYVVGWQPGSFEVLLEPSERPTLFGSANEGLPALAIIGKLFDTPDDPEKIDELISSENRGRLASAYRDFLEIIVEQQSVFALKWVDPILDKSETRRMSPKEALSIRTRLAIPKHLTEEKVSFSGKLVVVKRDTGDWELETENGKVSGKRK